MGVPAPVHVPGDCYVWGSSDPNTGSKPLASTVPGWLNSTVPIMVDNTTHLDVCEVSQSPHCRDVSYRLMLGSAGYQSGLQLC